MIHHCLRLPNQTSGMEQCCVHPGMPKCVGGALEDCGGQTEVASCPQSAVLLWTAMVLASLIPGLMNAGWQATKLTHEQLKSTNLRCPSKSWACMHEINKEETLPVCLIVLLHVGAQTESVAFLAKTLTGTELWGLCGNLFIQLSKLHNQYDSDIIVMIWSSVFPFRWEKPLHMCSQIILTCLHICRHSPSYHPCILTWHAK